MYYFVLKEFEERKVACPKRVPYFQGKMFYSMFFVPQSFAETFALKFTFSAYCIIEKEDQSLLGKLKLKSEKR